MNFLLWTPLEDMTATVKRIEKARTSTTVVAPPKPASIDEPQIFIKANPQAQTSSLQIDEVQRAMKEGQPELFSDDFLKSLEEDEDLMRIMATPDFHQMLADMQSNPEAALKR
eukprot:Clim_evm23s152 gene=Clim_evmTU23s152